MTTPALVSAGSVASGLGSAGPDFGQTTTAGNLLLAWAHSNDPTPNTDPSPLTIDSGSLDIGWTLIGYAGGGYNWNGLWYKADCSHADTPPNFSDSGYTVVAAVSEFSGVSTSSPLDQYGLATSTDPGYASSEDTAQGDLIVALSAWNGSNAAPSLAQEFFDGTGTVLTGNTLVQGNSGAEEEPFYMFSANVAGTGTYTQADEVNATTTENEGYVSSIIASFKAAS